MIKINLTKVYHKLSDIHKPDTIFSYRDKESGCMLIYDGWVQYTSDDQTLETLDIDKKEQVIVSFEYIPFIIFRITPVKYDDIIKYNLTSVSPISLKTYTEQQNRMENWGDRSDINECVNKAISITGGFINGLGKINENTGNYYD